MTLILSFVCVQSPKESHDLRSGAAAVGAERSCRRTGGHTFLDRPEHCIGIVGVSGNIRKRFRAVCRRGLLRAPQEGDGLRTGADAVRGEWVSSVPLVMPFSTAQSTASS